jgi:hypothetical protein
MWVRLPTKIRHGVLFLCGTDSLPGTTGSVRTFRVRLEVLELHSQTLYQVGKRILDLHCPDSLPGTTVKQNNITGSMLFKQMLE